MNAVEALRPWESPGLTWPDGGFRFHDAPPGRVSEVLTAVDEQWSTARWNGQPPATWLVEVAVALDGRLAGMACPNRVRVDAVCVPGTHGAALAQRVATTWPDEVLGGCAIDHAVAEAWDSWEAEHPVWTGSGRDLLELRDDVVVGLWWD